MPNKNGKGPRKQSPKTSAPKAGNKKGTCKK